MRFCFLPPPPKTACSRERRVPQSPRRQGAKAALECAFGAPRTMLTAWPGTDTALDSDQLQAFAAAHLGLGDPEPELSTQHVGAPPHRGTQPRGHRPGGARPVTRWALQGHKPLHRPVVIWLGYQIPYFFAPQSDSEKKKPAIRKSSARNDQIRGLFGSPPWADFFPATQERAEPSRSWG
jgi:hypothetical protein